MCQEILKRDIGVSKKNTAVVKPTILPLMEKTEENLRARESRTDIAGPAKNKQWILDIKRF